MSATYRTVWISDVHLGTPASRAADLSRFLDRVTADRLYLTGDILDIERMRGRASFTQSHRDVINQVFQLARHGLEVIYIPGNHDQELRALAGGMLNGIRVALDDRYTTVFGSRLLVTHGDVLDAQVKRHSSLEVVGAAAYRVLMEFDVQLNKIVDRFGRDHVPVSALVKQRIAAAKSYIAQFEAAAISYAQAQQCDGVVCGHIHRPSLREDNGIIYANDGDWVEHRTALAESPDGSLELLRWSNGQIEVERSLRYSRQDPAAA